MKGAFVKHAYRKDTEFADAHNFNVPEEWVFEDDGYSGASLVRPGLEKVRDLAAEGHIQAVLVYSPDRLSRKYAYQVLLTEEFSRYSVDTVFVNAPQSATPEDQLLLQFQGMIAEYERAQILERSRRGKRYRAKAGEVGVLSSAPYGYRFIRKGVDVAARFEVIAAEAEIVRLMFEKYTLGGLSIGAVARILCEKGVLNPSPGKMGTIHGMGDAAKSCLQGNRLLRQNASGSATENHTAIAAVRSFSTRRDNKL
ncbi:MAG: recombinase family protein [Desulfatirhabdiaceae bacterium]|nr:recombinase family protein [Desulfatirhabdiaceae bacterium]